MSSLNDFNAHDVDPMSEYKAIPAGDYLAVITDSENKQAKSGTGSYLELKLQVIEGDFKDKCLWTRLNLEHESPEAVKFARAELSSICRAVGVMQPTDSCELHDIPFKIKVKCKTRKDNGETFNDIANYHPVDSSPKPHDESEQASPPWKR